MSLRIFYSKNNSEQY